MAFSLKNRILLLVSVVSIVLILTQCSQSSSKKEESENCTKKSVNPNGDSELALLMRNMRTSTQSLKEIIKQGKLPEKFPEEFLKLHTAIPTDSTVKGPVFDALAQSYLNGLQQLYKSPSAELASNYNAVVDRCVDCHRQFCPGPIKAIKTLSIEK